MLACGPLGSTSGALPQLSLARVPPHFSRPGTSVGPFQGGSFPTTRTQRAHSGCARREPCVGRGARRGRFPRSHHLHASRLVWVADKVTSSLSAAPVTVDYAL